MGILAKYLPLKLLPYANRVMQAGAVWGVISYGCSAFFVGQGLWNLPFILLGGLFLFSAVFFFYAALRMKKFPSAVLKKNEPTPEKQIEKEKPFMEVNSKKDKILFFALMVGITGLSNTAYYVVVNWVPDMLHAVFNMPQEYSILITIVVPIISATCSIIVISLCEKYEKILKISGVFLATSIFLIFPLTFLYNYNLILSVVFIAISLATNVGGRAVFMGVMAFKMRTRINSGSYSALLNAFGAIIAGVIPPLIGTFIDSFDSTSGYGWSYLIASIIGAMAIVLLSVFAVWKKKQAKKL
jgi:cyanate permease